MKNLKTLTALFLALVMLCSCASNELPVAGDDTSETHGEFLTFWDVDKERRNNGISDEDARKRIMEEGWPPNVLIGTFEKHLIGSDYLFKVTDNVTGFDVQEYINVTLQLLADVEIGKEYCINPIRHHSALWDSYILSGYHLIMSRDLLSDDDIEYIRKNAPNRKYTPPDVPEKASLTPEFIERVDAAIVVTVQDKWEEQCAETIFDIQFSLESVIMVKPGYEKMLEEHISWESTEGFRINSDVEVGGRYMLMIEFLEYNDGFVFMTLAARSGVVVSEKSPEYALYEKAFRAG